MAVIEIERHDSPYSKNHSQSSISTAPVVAPGGGCSCCCCCCCTSTFMIPEAIILNTLTKRSQLTQKEIFKKYLLVYGIGFVIIYGLGVILATQAWSGASLGVLIGIGIFSVLGAVIVNPIVVSNYCSRAIDYPEIKKPIGLYVFLIGLLTTALYSGTIVPLMFM